MRLALLVGSLLALAACKGDEARKTSSATAAPSTDWAALEAAARPTLAPGPPDALVRALDLIAKAALPRELQAGFDPHDQALRAALPEDALAAVDALVEWDQVQGRLPPRLCAAPLAGPDGGLQALPVLALLHLGRAALVVASADADAPELTAVLHLAQRLRGEGLSLLEGRLGSGLADETRAWATKAGLPPVGALRAYAPTEDGLLRLVAAEATCSLALVGLMRTPAHRAERADVARLHHATTPAEIERALAAEEDGLRRFWLDFLTAQRGRAADPAGTDRALAARAEELRLARDREPLLSVMVAPTVHIVAELRTSDDQQRAWLAAAAPPPSP